MKHEFFKDIPGYEQRYRISNKGNIISLVGKTEKPIQPIKSTNKYLMVNLYDKNGQRHQELVHRLVAMTFIENPKPDKFKEVNHKDRNKYNNDADNLEWCDRFRNMEHSSSKKVAQIDLVTGEILKIWPSLKSVERANGWRYQGIRECANGHTTKSHGYKWSWVPTENEEN